MGGVAVGVGVDSNRFILQIVTDGAFSWTAFLLFCVLLMQAGYSHCIWMTTLIYRYRHTHRTACKVNTAPLGLNGKELRIIESPYTINIQWRVCLATL